MNIRTAEKTSCIFVLIMIFTSSVIWARSINADNAFGAMDAEEQRINKSSAPTESSENKDNIATIPATSAPAQAVFPVEPKTNRHEQITKQNDNATNQRIYIVHDYVVTVLDSKTYTAVNEFPGEFAIAVSSSHVISPETAYIAIYNRKDLKLLADFEYDGVPSPMIERAVITPNGAKMYVGSFGNGKEAPSGVYVIDLNNHKQEKVLYQDNIKTGLIGISNDGKYLFVSTGNGLALINTLDDTTYKEIPIGDNTDVEDIVVGTNNLVYMVTCFYDVESGSHKNYKLTVAGIEKGVIKEIALGADSNKHFRILSVLQKPHLFIVGNDKLFDFDTNTNSITLEKSFRYSVTPSAISSDGKLLYVKSENTNHVVVYDVEKGLEVKEIPFKDYLYDVIVK